MTRSLFTPIPDAPRFLTQDGCRALTARIIAMSAGGGTTALGIESAWTGHLRWGRNQVTLSSAAESDRIQITRTIRGATGRAVAESSDDETLRASVQRAEAILHLATESPDTYPESPRVAHPIQQPALWFDATYDANTVARRAVAEPAIAAAEEAELYSAGYIQVSARASAVVDSAGHLRYYQYTNAQYSITVRDRAGTASGWAGIDGNDWRQIDTATLSRIALGKCRRMRDAVAIEPEAQTAVLEPQAVCDLVAPLFDALQLDRRRAESGIGPFADGGGDSKIGQAMIDPRLTVSMDPMDPQCGFLPFDGTGEPYQAVNWIDKGTLTALAYDRTYAQRQLGRDLALPASGAFRMSGGTAEIEEMIGTTVRGVLITRLDNVRILDPTSMLMSGNTRDGLWLIERGKISRPLKNFRFTESPLFALNRIEQIGRSRRVFHPDAPVVVPPMRVRDFNFTALMDAV